MPRHGDNYWLERIAQYTSSGSTVATYNATQPTLADGATTPLQAGVRGSLRVELLGAGSPTGAVASASGADGVANTTTGLNMYTFPRVWNGATWDRLRGNVAGGLWSNVGATPTVSTVSVGTGSTTVLAANANRKKIILTNVGANNIYINMAGGTAVATNLLLAPNQTIIDDTWVTQTAITGIAATAATSLSVTEFA